MRSFVHPGIVRRAETRVCLLICAAALTAGSCDDDSSSPRADDAFSRTSVDDTVVGTTAPSSAPESSSTTSAVTSAHTVDTTPGTPHETPAETSSPSAATSAPPDVGTAPVTGPTPADMCADGTWPRAAAYEKETGAFRWASCTDELGWLGIREVSDEAVYLEPALPATELVALDPVDGTELTDAPPLAVDPEPEYTGEPRTIEVDGHEVTGGQDDPVTVVAPDGTRWSRDGVWSYDDVYAIGDGAVFAVERHPTGRLVGYELVGYELADGDIRWQHVGDPYAEGLWPWLVAEQRLYTLWYDLQVRATADGRLIWATDYGLYDANDPFRPPSPQAPRMSGVGVGHDLVFVSFTTEASGGD